ncbi:hypothetical protein Tco_1226769 [Tanacetum coccineum]
MVSSHPVFSPLTGCDRLVSEPRMFYTQGLLTPESVNQADGAQSSRVPVPLPEDPYEAIRQAYLVVFSLDISTCQTFANIGGDIG